MVIDLNLISQLIIIKMKTYFKYVNFFSIEFKIAS
jgi:hypothetical protein